MKRLAIVIFGASMLMGCSESVRLRVTHAPTGDAATDVLVQRRRPVNRWEKITNPVGATYHPHRVAESHWTDGKGECLLQGVGKNDILDIYTTSSVPLTVAVGTNTLALSPGTNEHFTTWVYHVWHEGGRSRFTVSKPSWNWNQEKPDQEMHRTKQPRGARHFADDFDRSLGI